MTRPARLTPQFLATSALLAWGLLPGDPASGRPLMIREILRNDLPSRADYDRIEHGYYEQILDADRRLNAVSGALAGHSEPVEVEHGRLTLKVADIREFVLKPNMTLDPGRRIPWSTNSNGMRDREYPEAKPSRTFRVGLAGDSIAAGWAVDDGAGFEPRLERMLDDHSRARRGPSVEVLNFSVPGHGPGQRWSHFSRVGWAFAPDLVIYEATPADAGWDERRLRALLTRGVGFDESVYREVLNAHGIEPGQDFEVYKRKLRPLRWDLLAGVYRAAVEECRSHNLPVVWILIPRVGKPADPAERSRLVALAREAGFTAVFDACDAFNGVDAAELAVGPNDFHPNAEGHARIAQALESWLAEQLRQAREQARQQGRAIADATEGAERR